jgi:hypothetical protein
VRQGADNVWSADKGHFSNLTSSPFTETAFHNVDECTFEIRAHTKGDTVEEQVQGPLRLIAEFLTKYEERHSPTFEATPLFLVPCDQWHEFATRCIDHSQKEFGQLADEYYYGLMLRLPRDIFPLG